MDNKYNGFSEEAFLDDPAFIRWIKYGEQTGDWELWLESNPPSATSCRLAIQKLKAILNATSDTQYNNNQEIVWLRIIGTIKKRSTVRLSTRWLAAASVVLVLISAIWLWSRTGNHNQQLENVSTLENKVNDLAPGGNRAILTLADGSKIILDSANNGAITKQGNVTVIKLSDGQVAYQPTTHNSQLTTIKYNTISTPRGGQYQLELADGSRVWLNAASSITFPTSFTGKERDVNITGEAYFEVAHNADMPFRVRVNDMSVEVLGTHFNINAYPDEGVIKTTLLEGSVRVIAGLEAVTLKPGQQANLQPSTFNLRTVSDVNLEEIVAWKDGLFYFNNTDLKEIMTQFGRWYDVDVDYEKDFPEKKFTGKIYRNVKASEVFRILEGLGVHFEIKNDKVIVKE